ncbi:nicotinic acid mononucleotide adenyltransferase [Polaribacter sp. Z014]|uniref:toxin-antitoxin system YwqK family antitoxin n=1 Tax=unclassified Polaribacter TaxID=196858 RepID=UPI00193C074B|nr:MULTISPECIES: nicotinic acid mononucleotide adenyltransferase [unclassified Polaribacter]MCL7762265.1 nicotinic acid mononucleotide adenyltransferase [Polaribacter sp. Z014]QVY64314.1 nicotinic acid mononucleotide adenyltransferase [Polaribacter sp. Q13]
MKKILTLIILCVAAIGYSQDKQPTYTAEGNLVKATYYYEDGSISTEGYFKDKKLTGEWTRFDKEGNKTQIAKYEDGKKVGKWFVWNNESLKEISYDNNAIVSVNLWKHEAKLASNK